MKHQVQIAVAQKQMEALDYWVSGRKAPEAGQWVQVPLRKKSVPGVIVGTQTRDLSYKLKDVEEALDLPPLSEKTVKFLQWMGGYTLTPIGTLLKMMVGNILDQDPPTPRTRVQWASWAKEWAVGLEGPEHQAPLLRELMEKMGLDEAEVAKLYTSGQLQPAGRKKTAQAVSPHVFGIIPDAPFALNDEQTAAVGTIEETLKAEKPKPLLIDGVTGSGKTEVYFQGLADVLKAGGQALVLLPEISLTQEWLLRFESRFGTRPFVWHSGIPQPQKREIWHKMLHGEAGVVVGARSALFLPFQKLKLIVVDEEHEQSYKQEEGGAIYHARDMAVARAHFESASIILCSATPSLESLENVEQGKYQKVILHARAKEGAQLPQVHLIDLRETFREKAQWLSPTLVDKLWQNKEQGGTSLLFLNRRGYAPLVLCQGCGHQFQCPNCDVWLSQHKFRNKLLCHHCGFEGPVPESCPKCGSLDDLVPCGPGVERLAEELAEKVPELKAEVLTSDSLKGPEDLVPIYERLASGDLDVIIGTQMLAKGHNFPRLSLVGVVDGDMGLMGGDPRSQEKTFQLLHQVAGRAGREGQEGVVYIQTYQPESQLMQALKAHDRDQLMGYEKEARSLVKLPPYGRLAAVILSAPQEAIGREALQHLTRMIPKVTGIQILGPAPAPLFKLRNWYRWRFLIKGEAGVSLQHYVRSWLSQTPLPRTVKLQIDIDPLSFF